MDSDFAVPTTDVYQCFDLVSCASRSTMSTSHRIQGVTHRKYECQFSSITDLIKLKQVTPELGSRKAITKLNDFIFKELESHEGVLTGQGRPDLREEQVILDELNRMYRQTISEAFDGNA